MKSSPGFYRFGFLGDHIVCYLFSTALHDLIFIIVITYTCLIGLSNNLANYLGLINCLRGLKTVSMILFLSCIMHFFLFYLSFGCLRSFCGFSNLVRFLQKFWVRFCLNEFKSS